MALLAKNSGMVKIWPMPMKRSRVLTRQAIISENVEKTDEANKATTRTNARFMDSSLFRRLGALLTRR
jgi:phenylpropionate dioxygenase-like ring-hydroxylating dioxygenase large terminal subunit